jgi:ElaB/YqjD/DUF883 family membrane-anchored ribosome-binding protein
MSEEKIPGAENTPDVEKNKEVEKDKSTLNDAVESIKESVSDVVDAVKDAVDSTVDTIKEQAPDVMDDVKDKLSDIADKASEMAEAAKDKAAEVVSDARDKASDLADAAKDKAADVVSDLKEKASEMADKATEMADAAKEKAVDVVSDVKEKAADVVDAAKDKIEDIKNPEPNDENGTAEPAAESKASEAAAEPTNEAKTSEEATEPAAEVKSSEESAEPAAEAKTTEEATEPTTEAKTTEPASETAAKTPEEPQVDLGTLTLAQLSELFDKFSQSEDRMKRYKEAEAIKSAFYKRLSKEKADAGLGPKVDEPSSREDVIEEVGPQTQEEKENPFAAIETAFKGVYANYKRERAEYNRQQDELREENYQKKLAVIEELKALVEKQEDVNTTFPAFRELQNKWREIGPVPASKYMDLNNNYQFYVEQFYDMVKINRDLRDLDFKKNLEVKTKFCEEAEKLAEDENVVEAFHELQKLHEQWKEYGPVAKEYRESIWDRFKAATSVINKKYQAYFEAQKEKQVENLARKTELCEKVEAIANKEDIKSSSEWNNLTTQIEDIQKTWRTIGFATKKENQKIYDRFRAACDKFFNRKREFYVQFKNEMTENVNKKLALIEQAEAMKDSTDWKKTTQDFINLQKQWKEIGTVPRKKSEQLWKRFRAACDAFFNERDKNVKPENDYYGNLKAKRALIEEINGYELSEDADVNTQVAKDFSDRWQSIGYVPYKEKDNIQKAFADAMQAKFPDFQIRTSRGGGRGDSRRPMTEKDRLVQQYNKLQQDIVTYENNIGFFSESKNSAPLIKQMQEKIDASKAELSELEAKIRKAEESEDEK